MGHDRGCGEEHAEAVPADFRVPHARVAQLFLDDPLQLGLDRQTSEAHREVHPTQAEVVLGAAERNAIGGVVLGEELVGECGHPAQFGGGKFGIVEFGGGGIGHGPENTPITLRANGPEFDHIASVRSMR